MLRPSFVALLVFVAPLSAAGIDYDRDVLPLLKSHCHGCHGGAKPKGGLDLTTATANSAAIWKDVLTSLRGKEMPPAEKPQLKDASRELLLKWLEQTLASPDLNGLRDPGKPVLRRLTRHEYNNTLRELLGLSTDLFLLPERLPMKRTYFDPSRPMMASPLKIVPYEAGEKRPVFLAQCGLPGDNRAEHGFSNRGDAMNVSPLLLEKYLATAADIVTDPKFARQAKPIADPASFTVFLARALRRTPTPAQVANYLRPYELAKQSGLPEAEAWAASLRAVLASPDFLFRVEPVDTKQGPVRPLNDYELASRLSYFLWAGMPDEEIFSLAKDGSLNSDAMLERQARRMLKNPRVRELTESFAVQWARLNELWAMQPDAQMFPGYYAGPQGKTTLAADLMTEAVLQFETVLVEDRSVFDFIDADYGYLNHRLVKHYGLAKRFENEMIAAGIVVPPDNPKKGIPEDIWIRIRWPDRTRGGLLTSGAVLTLTSLPQRTSPVKRGAWVLETIYNRPPSPPAVAVEPLDSKPASETGLTVRQKLEQHRTQADCKACHNRIDPPGFALENYDAIGAWRSRDGALAIDANGVLPDGRTFDGPAQFKDRVLEKKQEFLRGFVEHLLSYALGRPLEHFDEPAVNAIVEATLNDGGKLSRVVVEIVKSYPFRNVRNLPEAQR